MTKTLTFDSAAAARDAAAEELMELLAAAKGKPVLLVVSGGSSMALMDAAFSGDDFGTLVTAIPLDERAVTDPKESNAALFKATKAHALLKDAGGSFIDTRMREGETGASVAERYDTGLRAWLEAHPHGTVLATLGVGADGHVAGMLPDAEDPEGFERRFGGDEPHAVRYDTPEGSPFRERITLNLPALRRIDTAIVYAVGDKPLAAALAGEAPLAETPAAIITHMKDVRVFTDIPL